MGTQAAESPEPPCPPPALPPTDHNLPPQHSPPVSLDMPSPPPPPPQSQSPPPSTPPQDALPPPPEATVDATAPAKKDHAASLDAERARVQSLISRLVTRAHAQAPAAPQDGPAGADSRPAEGATAAPAAAPPPPAPRGAPKHPAPFEWSETAVAASLVYRVPADTRTAHVSVTFDPDRLALAVAPPDPKRAFSVTRDLRRRITVDSCWWALEDRADGSRVLLVELEKTVPGVWGGVFAGDEQGRVDAPPRDASGGDAAERDAEDAGDTRRDAAPDAPPPASGDAAQGKGDETVDGAVAGFVESVIGTASAGVDSSASAASADAAEPATEVEDVPEEETAPVGGVADGDTIVASATESAGGATGASSSSDEVSPSEPNGRKILTRADLPKMVAQHRAAVAARGKGWAEAAVQLGTLYHYGIGVPHDDSEAARLYRLGLENGATDASAAFQLGLICNQGDGANFRPDAEEAVKWWTEAARLGNSVAMFNLGVMCMNGSGCEMDPVAAMRWFEKARELNPRLETPQLSAAQLEQRIIMARRVQKERRWAAMSDEERERRRTEALAKLRLAVATTAGVAGLTVGALLFRNWWRNRL